MRTMMSLDQGWRFHPGDIARTNTSGGMEAYRPRMHWTKSGRHHLPSMPEYDDASWRLLDVPHDWAVEGLPDSDPAVDVNHGSRVGGVAWYRRCFAMCAEDAGRRWQLVFEGVYRDCEVWVNGCFAGANRSGYIGFSVDLSEWLRFGGDNVVAVRVDASEFEGWWYEGAGIYRHVWLRGTAPLHIAEDGVFTRTRVDDRGWALLVDVEIDHVGSTSAEAEVVLVLCSAEGRDIGTVRAGVSVAADSRAVIPVAMPVPHPHPWTPDDPYLYRLVVQLVCAGVIHDQVELATGLRTVAVDAARGFLLNGVPLKLRGVSCHQDFAAFGVALPDAMHEHRIHVLKSMGANAYRTAHHAPAPALLAACDRLGVLVLDEARMFGTSEEALSQWQRLVRRDRSHPSVVMWSLGNEEMALQGNDIGARIARRMQRMVHRLDGSRPTTLAMNGDWFGPLATDPTCVDVVGFNYSPGEYDRFHAEHPQRPMIGTETAATLATRGHHGPAQWQGRLTWDQHLAACAPRAAADRDPGYCQADGDTCAAFGAPPWEAWRAVAERPFVMGTFIWTGFDYRGEPCPLQRWPNINTNFGLTDLCGFPKDIWWYYRAWWKDDPVIHLLPHWDWPGREGEPIRVRCFANAAQVALRLNGQALGAQVMPRHGYLDWMVPYMPGVLEAIGTWPDGSERRVYVATSGRPQRLALRMDPARRGADDRSVALVRIAVEDDAAREVVLASPLVRVWTSGGARLIGVHNGDPAFTEAEHADRVRLFNGLALAVVERIGDAPVLHTDAPGLNGADIALI